MVHVDIANVGNFTNVSCLKSWSAHPLYKGWGETMSTTVAFLWNSIFTEYLWTVGSTKQEYSEKKAVLNSISIYIANMRILFYIYSIFLVHSCL